MKMKTAGRPKKKNAIQSGELQWELCRFSFIAERRIVADIKQIAKDEGVTIKSLMHKMLTQAITDKKATAKKIVKKPLAHQIKSTNSASQRNEDLLRRALNQQG